MKLNPPTGTYDGRTLSPWLATRWVWHGKVFTGATVVNRIGPWLLVRGMVTSDVSHIYIRYAWGLTDVLTPNAGGYDGRLLLGPITIRFELARARKQRGK